MMSYGSEILFGGSDNVLEWDKPQCILKFEKKVFLNDPNGGGSDLQCGEAANLTVTGSNLSLVRVETGLDPMTASMRNI